MLVGYLQLMVAEGCARLQVVHGAVLLQWVADGAVYLGNAIADCSPKISVGK